MNKAKIKLSALLTWFDSSQYKEMDEQQQDEIDWLRIIPFVLLHLSCFAVIWVGVSYVAVITCALLYALRVFAIGGFYHRYFSHKSFKTSRVAQFIFACLGVSAVQRGPLWWASHHRHHHLVSDQPQDVHSPIQHSFLWSHMGWFLSKKNFHYKHDLIKDFSAYPELVFIDRFDILIPIILAGGLFLLGSILAAFAPGLHTNGWQLLVWGFCISTVLVFQVTFCVNTICHKFGHRRYNTKDASRNNSLVALFTFGEGWHNNHHRFPCSARQGFYWWQIDITYYLLRLLALFGIIHDLRAVPANILHEGRQTINKPAKSPS